MKNLGSILNPVEPPELFCHGCHKKIHEERDEVFIRRYLSSSGWRDCMMHTECAEDYISVLTALGALHGDDNE